VRFQLKVAISSHITLCQTAYQTASENVKGSEEGECSTCVEVEVAATEAARFDVFGCRGLRVIGWLLRADGDAGEHGGSEETYGS
jgi:hypothetical protein